MATNYEHLGAAVSQEVNENSFTAKFLAEYLCSYMKLSRNSLSGKNLGQSGFTSFLRNVGHGDVYGSPGTPKNPENCLEWLAVLLYALNFSEKHPGIIDELKKIDDRFEYPPENGISYYELVKAHKAELMKKGEKIPAQGLDTMV